jgi:hypothetical protein
MALYGIIIINRSGIKRMALYGKCIIIIIKRSGIKRAALYVFVIINRSGIKRAALYGLVFAVSQCFIYFAYAAAFTYGAYLVIGGLEFQDVFR